METTRPITDEDRRAICRLYQSSHLTQDEFCRHIGTKQGIRLRPRTLRNMLRKFTIPPVPEKRLQEILGRTIQELQDLVAALEAAQQSVAAQQATRPPATVPATRPTPPSPQPAFPLDGVGQAARPVAMEPVATPLKKRKFSFTADE